MSSERRYLVVDTTFLTATRQANVMKRSQRGACQTKRDLNDNSLYLHI